MEGEPLIIVMIGSAMGVWIAAWSVQCIRMHKENPDKAPWWTFIGRLLPLLFFMLAFVVAFDGY